jgi:peptidoglycan/LPS O-acetylase OafA/YrhL
MGTLRFMLALAVAAGHASSFFGTDIYPRVPGAHAVQVFYIISGFLIALILSGKYADTPQGNWIFYTNRAVKIYVPYLVIVAVTVAVWLAIYATTGKPGPLNPFIARSEPLNIASWAYAIFTNLFLIGMEWGSFLIERSGELTLSVFAYENPPNAIGYSIIVPAWTLSLELMFYLIAPFILRRHFLLIAGLALASYSFRFQAYSHGFRSVATEYRFFPFELSLFLYGALSYRFYLFLKERDLFRPTLSVAITVACVLTAISLPKYFRQHPHQMYAVVGVLLPALYEFSTRYRWDKWIGDLSYPLYLIHWPVCVLLVAFVGPNGAYAYPAVIASILLTIGINHFLVYPIDQWRQHRARSVGEHAKGRPSTLATDNVAAG